MQVGQLYSCQWRNRSHNTNCPNEIRGWDVLLFLGKKNGDETLYRFLDMLSGTECVMVEGLAKHCKELNKEEKCTQ